MNTEALLALAENILMAIDRAVTSPGQPGADQRLADVIQLVDSYFQQKLAVAHRELGAF